MRQVSGKTMGLAYKSLGHLRVPRMTGCLLALARPASSGFSLASTRKSGLHLGRSSEFASIRLPQTLADVIHLPTMKIQISLNRFIDNVASIPIEGRGYSIQRS
jgi:hypothetical protein